MSRSVRFRNSSQTAIRQGAAVMLAGTAEEPGGTMTLGAEMNEEAAESCLGIAEAAVNRDSIGTAVRESGSVVPALVVDAAVRIGMMLQTSADGRLQTGTMNAIAQAYENKAAGDGKASIRVLLL